MLHLLPTAQYASALALFDKTVPLYCLGVLTGKYPGQVLVNDLERPQTAVILKDVWTHLIGNPSNHAFNLALKSEMREKTLIGSNTNVLFFMDPPQAWLPVLQTLVEHRQPIETPRCLYVATPATPLPIPHLPHGFTLHPIDETISTKADGDLPDDVQKILALRQNAQAPNDMAFGFVAMHGRTCAAWSVIDFIVGEIGEIRLVTESRYRRHGLAWATSAATIAYGLAHGLQQIEWNAAASNTPSIRTAQKLGLTLHHEPREYVLIFPEVGYFINLAWSHLDAHRFGQVHEIAAQMIASDKEVLQQYGQFLTAAAWAGLGQQAQAIHHLQAALDAGFDDWAEMENVTQFQALHGLPAWKRLVQRLQN